MRQLTADKATSVVLGNMKEKIVTDKSEPISTGIQCHSYVRAKVEKKVGRKGLIRARAAL